MEPRRTSRLHARPGSIQAPFPLVAAGAGSPGGPPEEIPIFPIPVVPAQRERQCHLPGPHQQGRCCRARAGREKGSLETCPKLHPLAQPQPGLCKRSATPLPKPALLLGLDFGFSGPISSRDGDLGVLGCPSPNPCFPVGWGRMQPLPVPNDHHHHPLLGFAAPLFLRQLVLGLCHWLLPAGVPALDQVGAPSGQHPGFGWVFSRVFFLIQLRPLHLCAKICAAGCPRDGGCVPQHPIQPPLGGRG